MAKDLLEELWGAGVDPRASAWDEAAPGVPRRRMPQSVSEVGLAREGVDNETPSPSSVSYLEELILGAGGKPGIVPSVASGAQRGLLREYGDELQGALGAALTPGATPPARPGEPPPEPYDFGERYRLERDDARRFQESAKEAHPKLEGATALGGTLVNEGLLASLTGGASATPIGQALTGGVEGLGRSEADLTKPSASSLGRAVFDTALGAGASYGGAKLGEVLAPAAKSVTETVSRKLGDFAASRSLKATGAIQHNLKKMSRDKQRALGEDILREGLQRFGDLPADILARAEALLGGAGSGIGGVLDTVDEVTKKGFDWDAAAFALIDKMAKMDPAERDLIEAPMEHIIGLMAKSKEAGGGFAMANRLKSISQDLIGKFQPDINVRERLKNQVTGMLREEIDDQLERAFGKAVAETAKASSPSLTPDKVAKVGELAGDAIGDKFAELKRLYGLGADVQDLAKAGTDRMMGNRWLSATDYLTALGAGGGAGGMTAALSGSPVKALAAAGVGLATGLAHKVARERGSSMLAPVSLAASDALEGLAEEGVRRGMSVLGAEAGRGVAESFTPEQRQEAMRRLMEQLQAR